MSSEKYIGNVSGLGSPPIVNPNPVDMVNHPPHYKNHPSGIECIEITRHFNFNRGNAIKYIWRAGSKTQDLEGELEDLRKAAWYINDEIEKLKRVIKGDPKL